MNSPLPPFDGYGVIEPFLDPVVRAQVARWQGGLVWIVFLVLWYVPFVNNIFWDLIFGISGVMGIPLNLVRLGYSQFMFWRR